MSPVSDALCRHNAILQLSELILQPSHFITLCHVHVSVFCVATQHQSLYCSVLILITQMELCFGLSMEVISLTVMQ